MYIHYLRGFGWSNLGIWASLYEEKEKDYLNNAVNGKMLWCTIRPIILLMYHKKLVVIQGLENFIVVDTEDVLLICNKDEEQRIKKNLPEI